MTTILTALLGGVVIGALASLAVVGGVVASAWKSRNEEQDGYTWRGE